MECEAADAENRSVAAVACFAVHHEHVATAVGLKGEGRPFCRVARPVERVLSAGARGDLDLLRIGYFVYEPAARIRPREEPPAVGRAVSEAPVPALGLYAASASLEREAEWPVAAWPLRERQDAHAVRHRRASRRPGERPRGVVLDYVRRVREVDAKDVKGKRRNGPRRNKGEDEALHVLVQSGVSGI